jgi:hypothetical protein
MLNTVPPQYLPFMIGYPIPGHDLKYFEPNVVGDESYVKFQRGNKEKGGFCVPGFWLPLSGLSTFVPNTVLRTTQDFSDAELLGIPLLFEKLRETPIVFIGCDERAFMCHPKMQTIEAFISFGRRFATLHVISNLILVDGKDVRPGTSVSLTGAAHIQVMVGTRTPFSIFYFVRPDEHFK